MDVIKTTVRENGNNITGQTFVDQKIEDRVGIRKIMRFKSLALKIFHQLRRRKLVLCRHIRQGNMLTNNCHITCIKGLGILLLKDGPTAGICPRLKHGNQAPVRPSKAQGTQGLPHCGRMMGKIINDRYAVFLTANLLPTLDSFKTSQSLLHRFHGKSKMIHQGYDRCPV